MAFLECGQYDKSWPTCHMFPEQSVKAAIDIGAKVSVPVHWGAYCLCNVAWNDSVKRFSKCARKNKVKYITPMIGECIDYDNLNMYHKKWWI